MEKTKSAESRAPVPSFLLATFSLKYISAISLSLDTRTESITGGTISFKLTELLSCTVLEIFPLLS